MVSGALGGNHWRLSCSVQFGSFRNYFKFVKESGERDEGPLWRIDAPSPEGRS